MGVRFDGTLRDGTRFAPSGQLRARLDQVMPCWTEGLQRMRVGGRSRLGCPASLAYGSRGTARIPAGSALIYELELLTTE